MPRVIIDDVEYIPAPPVHADNTLEAALEVRLDSDAGDGTTIRDYLHALLMTLWREQEDFSGKRPFGNSGWYIDLYKPLIKNGFISGVLDEDGCLEEYDEKEADRFVDKLINAVFYGVKKEEG